MSDSSADAEKELRFQFSWSFKVSEFGSCAFNEKVSSPAFKTVHNNIGFQWRLYILPNGGRTRDKEDDGGKEYHGHLGIFTEYLGKKELKAVLSATCDYFVEVGEQVKKRRMAARDTYGEKYCSWGYPAFLPRSVDEMRADGLISDGEVLKLGIVLKISKSEFSWQKILEEEEAKIEKHSELNFCHLFEDIITTRSGEGEGRTNQEPEQKVLDFKILASDQELIWCHKVILIKKNAFFKHLVTSEMKEGESSQMGVKFDSVTMKELLHFIYTGRVSDKFPDSDLLHLLDGAEMYELPGLKLICERKMIEQIEVDNAAEYLELADRYGLKILREVSLNFASENASEIRKTEKGKKLPVALLDAIFEVVQERSRVVKVPSWMKVY